MTKKYCDICGRETKIKDCFKFCEIHDSYRKLAAPVDICNDCANDIKHLFIHGDGAKRARQEALTKLSRRVSENYKEENDNA